MSIPPIGNRRPRTRTASERSLRLKMQGGRKDNNAGTKRLRDMRKSLQTRIVNLAAPQIYARFAQLADEAAEGSSDESYLGDVAEDMRDVKSWSDDSFRIEAREASRRMPALKELLSTFAAVDHRLLHGEAGPEDAGEAAEGRVIAFVSDVYVRCAAHFARFPMLVCSSPGLDPSGEIYRAGEAEVSRMVARALDELVPAPRRPAAQRTPSVTFAPEPARTPATPPATRREPPAVVVPEAVDLGEVDLGKAPGSPPAPTPAAQPSVRATNQAHGPLSKTARVVPLRRRSDGSGSTRSAEPSRWRDD